MIEPRKSVTIAAAPDLHRQPAGPRSPAGTPSRIDAADHAADAAARAAGVRVREISSLGEFDAMCRLLTDIWRPDPQNPPATRELLRAFSQAGNYVAGAFDGDDLVGAGVGFFAAPAEAALHSHIAGVAAAARGRNVGFALKVHQRAWSMRRGVSAVAWTYDPLVRRNAYFNIVKLAARPEEYLRNFYGGMHDAINGDDDSDRLLVRWLLDDPSVVAACAGTTTAAGVESERSSGGAVALGVSALGGPVTGPLDDDPLLVAVPTDIEGLRVTDPGCAQEWRLAVRGVLGPLLADGARIAGFDRAGWYIVRRSDSDREENR